jgi:hypothetical protein
MQPTGGLSGGASVRAAGDGAELAANAGSDPGLTGPSYARQEVLNRVEGALGRGSVSARLAFVILGSLERELRILGTGRRDLGAERRAGRSFGALGGKLPCTAHANGSIEGAPHIHKPWIYLL